MNEIVIPRESLERLLADALKDKEYWETCKVESMANWHEGRAAMAHLILSVYGK